MHSTLVLSPSTLGLRIAKWLLQNQQADGRILDPIHREYGTYSDGFASLAFGLMQQRSSESCWERALSQSLRIAEHRPADSEFDQLALLLLAVHTGKRFAVRVYDGRRLVSNNWVAMRALNLSLQAKLSGRHKDEERARALWQKVLCWQQADGLFVDSPGGNAIPLTYHAKFCAMLALTLELTDPPERETLLRALASGLDSLEALISPGGCLVPYGRSRHSLFGYAATILALSLGSNLLKRNSSLNIQRLLRYLEKFQVADGHIPCVLRNGEESKRDWDVYVNNPDYNAYAAALLLLTPDISLEPKVQLSGGLTQIGPILTWRNGDWFLAVSGKGACVLRGTPFFCDPRYYGMRPLWIEYRGTAVFDPPPYLWGERNLLVDPRTDPWLPFLECGASRYCTPTYSALEINVRDTALSITARGGLESYRSLPRAGRALMQLLGGPAPMYYGHSLRNSEQERSLVWKPGSLQSSSKWSGQWPVKATIHAENEAWAMSDLEKERI